MKKITTLMFLSLIPLPKVQADWGSGITAAGGFSLPNTLPETILQNFLMWLLLILTLIGVLAFIISGIMFITSGGNPEQANRAKDYVKYSIIGIAISLSGYIIIRFIDDILMGVI